MLSHARKDKRTMLTSLGPVAHPSDKIIFFQGPSPDLDAVHSFISISSNSPLFGSGDACDVSEAHYVVFLRVVPSPEIIGTLRTKGWIIVFQTRLYTILENAASRSIKRQEWGLSEVEIREAFSIARRALASFLLKRPFAVADFMRTTSLDKYSIPGDICVALWVSGRIRGSMIVQNKPLVEGIVKAAVRATIRDERFKPLSHKELQATRIEITLLSNLKIPLTEEEIQQPLPYADKAYILRKNDSQGWFLPEVFNTISFNSHAEFLGRLASEKAGLRDYHSVAGDVSICEVADYIETDSEGVGYRLHGPLVMQQEEKTVASPQDFIRMSLPRLHEAALWLCRIQEEDGNIPPVLNPLGTLVERQIDWPRLAFTALALTEFGTSTRNKSYQEAGEKVRLYLRPFLLSDVPPERLSEKKLLALVYFLQLSNALHQHSDVSITEKLFARVMDTEFDPILYSQTLSLLQSLHSKREAYCLDFSKQIQILHQYIAKKINSLDFKTFDLATWAEAVSTFHSIDREGSLRLAQIIGQCQLPDGSFPQSPSTSFAYTRGTAKILEVLALYPAEFTGRLINGFSWLLSNQYSKTNTFFIPDERKEYFLGGFRHDTFHQSAWIDSAGHALLAATRLLR